MSGESKSLVEQARSMCHCNIETSPCGAEEDCRLTEKLCNTIERLERERDAARKRAIENRNRADRAEIKAKNYASFNHEWRQRAEAAEARLAVADEDRMEMYILLDRYRNETPLGHQPHMIASRADDLLNRIRARVGKDKSND